MNREIIFKGKRVDNGEWKLLVGVDLLFPVA